MQDAILSKPLFKYNDQMNIEAATPSANKDTQTRDIIVIGGGPAGTTAATLLAQKGWQVTLFEREIHPRFHIGESLLPMNLPIFEKLGVLDQVAAAGIQKNAAVFTSPSIKAKPTRFPFANALGESPPHAYQIERSKLDKILFDNSTSSGVQTLEQHEVMAVSLASDGAHQLKVRDADNNISAWHCRYVLDASGQQSLISKQQKWRIPNSRHTASAVFAHFSGIPLNQGDGSGDINVYWFDQGWMWFIPLGDELMSVGIVSSPDYLKTRKPSESLCDFLGNTVKKSFAAHKRFKNGMQLFPAKALSNYSYTSSQRSGEGFTLIGDAHTFIDPIFSSGVYLAMSGAERVVPLVDHWLRGNRLRYAITRKRYEQAMTGAVKAFSWFIYRFTTPQMEYLFQNPRNILGVEQAVVSMLAGDVYKSNSVHLRLLVFKFIFFMAGIFGPAKRRKS